jgi:hypothetical protein
MKKLGILAYGSLIEDPGIEIEPLIIDKIENVETPFKVEFSRTSSSRNGAPTLVPVENGGSTVKASILILNNEVLKEQVIDLVWRRETRNEKTNKHYAKPNSSCCNKVIIEEINNFSNIETVLFTKIGTNIERPTPKILARYAINSAKQNAGRNRLDGISYLIALKKQKIITPLSQEYENKILEILGVNSLEDAYHIVRKRITKRLRT